MQRTLFLDADDTLWENNIYFERVVAAFLRKLQRRGVPTAIARQRLWDTEQRIIRRFGYGSHPFCRALAEVARQLACPDLTGWIYEQQQLLANHPIELMPGVAQTLPALAECNRLILVTKGDPDEQLGKLHRAQLARYFTATEVVFEKNVATYRRLLRRHRAHAAHSWMIGNSPRSDINPAKAAGLNTVFIPYHTTWQHELEEISSNGGHTLVLDHFGQLADHFLDTRVLSPPATRRSPRSRSAHQESRA
ncbi:MAG: HAD hydrolase-like protein [Verrucomicrobiae bacterium]|nr:HAD hydrolase-like protein [Verrucomicrobiae bacterium]